MAFDHPKFARMDAGVTLRERHERFCGHYVEHRDPARAFRYAFVVDNKAMPAEVFRQAKELLADPEHRARINELREAALLQIGMGVRDLLQDWADIASADPNEIVAHRRGACRFCHGIGHKYQWKDADEYTAACELATFKKTAPPPCDGGFEFNPTLDPVPTCPGCYGRGEGYVHIADTTQLTGPARKLYAGAKQDRFGCVEVMMHDQQKARESLARVWGMFKDLLPAANPTPPSEEKPIAVTAETAKKTYLGMLEAGKGQLQLIQGGKR